MFLLAIASSLILLVTSKGEGAPETMTPELWQQIARDYVGAKTSLDGNSLPAAADCRAKGAAFAVLATFDRIAMLPGGAPRDPDRAYAIARFAVRNCIDGTEGPTKAVVLESEPLESALQQNDALGARVWARPVRNTLAHNPLRLTLTPEASAAVVAQSAARPGASPLPVMPNTAISRISKIVAGDEVLIDYDPAFQQGQTLKIVSPPNQPANDAVLVVAVITYRGIRAVIVHQGAVPVHVGDIVTPR